MKRLLIIVLAALVALSLCACDELDTTELVNALNEIEWPTESTAPESAPVEETAQPEPTEEPEETAEPEQTVAEESAPSNRVFVSISSFESEEFAPDNPEQLILTFSYESPIIHIEGRDDVATKLNDFVAQLDENFYIGSGSEYDLLCGYNGMLEQALDNYTFSIETGTELNLVFACVRSVTVPRADSSVITMLYNDYVYTGGAHGVYGDNGYVFDAETGDRLTLESITSDYLALKELLVNSMVSQTESNEAWAFDDELEDLPATVGGLLRDGNWYFDSEGIVIFSDLYEIASYAEGIIKYNIPYSELNGLIDDKYLPRSYSADGSVRVVLQSELPAGTEIIDKVTADAEGQELCLVADGSIYNVKISSVDYSDVFYYTGEYWYCSYMTDCAIQLLSTVPEGMPNLMVDYIDGAGVEHHMLLTHSGVDGSLILSENVEAVG